AGAGPARVAAADGATLSLRRLNRRYEPPVPLGREHVLEGFECRSREQTSWLRRYARQSAAMGTTRVFVVTEPGDPRGAAYHAWCMAHVTTEAATPRARKGGGRYPQPVALLARLGVEIGRASCREGVRGAEGAGPGR